MTQASQATAPTPPRASSQGGTHPRPQLLRAGWTSLDGAWGFAHDDADVGRAAHWEQPATSEPFDRTITVPFPPESPASGIDDPGFHPVVWYRRSLRLADLQGTGDLQRLAEGSRLLLHLGAVDHAARVWVDGHLAGQHVGGQTPFTLDVTDLLETDADGELDPEAEHVLVVRAEEDPHDVALPRGKQDWRPDPHAIWYRRTTGIWRSVWAEVVPAQHVVDLAWTTDVVRGVVRGEVTLAQRPSTPVRIGVEIALVQGEHVEVLGEVVTRLDGPRAAVEVPLAAWANHQDRQRLLWRPGSPTLLDARVRLLDGSGAVVDDVASYVGMRSTSTGRGQLLLNDQPYEMRSVLEQGYWPQTHLAAPSAEALRREAELILELGFNAVRVHQKAADPRFLHWADRLGLLVWGETANAYEFSPTAVRLLAQEWTELVMRDRSHPCVVAWVPLNESWGVGDIASDPAQQHYAVGLAELTRGLDPTRPVISNDGWEHVSSDVLGVHDYSGTGAGLLERYGDSAAVERTLAGMGPAGRRLRLAPQEDRDAAHGRAPLAITEFGGISYVAAEGDEESWGYSTVSTDEEYVALITELYDALRACPDVVGSCYTQLTDTGQETNGLLREDRTPKVPMELLRAAITGRAAGA